MACPNWDSYILGIREGGHQVGVETIHAHIYTYKVWVQ